MKICALENANALYEFIQGAAQKCLLIHHRSTYIYLTTKKLDGFYFSVISWFLRNPTYHRLIFIALVYVHHTHLFSTRLSFQIT